jgi:metal-responsive CopG/Arc/MetJ family transcriptional regulator
MVVIGMVQMRKIMVSMTEEMVESLEEIRKERKLATIPETARVVIGEYVAHRERSG